MSKIPSVVVLIGDAIEHYRKLEVDFNRLRAITGLSDDELREKVARSPYSLEVLAEFCSKYGEFPDE